MKKKKSKNFLYDALVGIGGNEGDVKKRFDKLIRFWMNDKRLKVVQTSFILQNPPFGYLNQNSFYNGIIKVQTSLSPKRFLAFLMHTEKRFGRVRSFKNAPRTLDLDIIIFDKFEQKDKRLTLPHPKWQERISVLIPLMDIKW